MSTEYRFSSLKLCYHLRMTRCQSSSLLKTLMCLLSESFKTCHCNPLAHTAQDCTAVNQTLCMSFTEVLEGPLLPQAAEADQGCPHHREACQRLAGQNKGISSESASRCCRPNSGALFSAYSLSVSTHCCASFAHKLLAGVGYCCSGHPKGAAFICKCKCLASREASQKA